MAENKQSTEGKPMFVETLMNKDEWNTRRKTFLTSHLSWEEAWKDKPNSFKWRKNMGGTLPPDEIKNINANLDYIMQQALVKQN